MKISEKLKDLKTAKIDEIKDLQGNLKDLSEKNYAKLKNSIDKYGFIIPFFVWIDENGELWTLDGHQRKRLITKEFGNVEVPYIEIEAKTKTEAKEKILLISSQYGQTTKDGFDEFSFDLDIEFIDEFTTFDNLIDIDIDEISYEDKNKEIDVNEFSDKMILKFEVSEDEYHFIIDELQKINANKELALLKLLIYVL